VKLEVVILAAGQGTRMRSALPKVLHPLAGKALVHHVIDTATALDAVAIHTEIGHGAPTMHGTARTHGAPLGPDEVRGTKLAAGWPLEPTFLVPPEARAFYGQVAAAGTAARQAWDARFAAWRAAHPDLAATWDACRAPAAFDDLAGFEEASRALFAGNRERFDELVEPWPGDVRDYARKLAAAALGD